MERTDIHPIENLVHTLIQLTPQDYMGKEVEVGGWAELLAVLSPWLKHNCPQLFFGYLGPLCGKQPPNSQEIQI